MVKFSEMPARSPVQVLTTNPPGETPVTTYEGAPGHELDAKSQLFVLAASMLAGEDTFYESADQRDIRFKALVHRLVVEDPAWLISFGGYLRDDLKIRSASVMLACEYVAAKGPEGRKLVDSVCQRPDEPAEVIGYWHAYHGRKIPAAIKRGVADAASRLYHQHSAIKWDGTNSAIRFADVIELVHPKPRDDGQARLFKYLLDDRHHSDGNTEGLDLLAYDRALQSTPPDLRREVARRPEFAEARWPWERLAGWLPGGMDAEAWETAIPNMGVMALIRNLRNFDGAGISESAVDSVIDKITSAEDVKRSRIFPYQVWSAYAHAPSDNWQRALSKTLDLTCGNIPESDNTLILIDTSGSMQQPVSGRSQMLRLEVAAVMAAATWKRSTNVKVVIFGRTSAELQIRKGTSALKIVEAVTSSLGAVGHSTYGHTAIRDHFDKHDRVVMFTDDQQHDSEEFSAHAPRLYTFDLAGYGRRSTGQAKPGRYTMAGFSDATFRFMDVVEQGMDVDWPWE